MPDADSEHEALALLQDVTATAASVKIATERCNEILGTVERVLADAEVVAAGFVQLRAEDGTAYREHLHWRRDQKRGVWGLMISVGEPPKFVPVRDASRKERALAIHALPDLLRLLADKMYEYLATMNKAAAVGEEVVAGLGKKG